jgi:hypothetical protein
VGIFLEEVIVLVNRKKFEKVMDNKQRLTRQTTTFQTGLPKE